MKLCEFLECEKGMLFVVSGPSGTGKGTICKKVIENIGADISVSMTTRKPRDGEIDGKDYFFVTEEEFVQTIKDKGFLEHANVFGNRYGTPKANILEKLNSGKDVILEIDVQGAVQIKETFPEAVLIFALPPTMKELRRRIIKRGTETKQKINERLAKSIDEVKFINRYDYAVINANLEIAVSEVESILIAEHLRLKSDINKIITKYEEEC
ncbi:MAG: guanylate kinase [Peptostreptococcaceae bacterium]|nr:guanylate kinase [Peptostreptococcaceae bacterium]